MPATRAFHLAAVLLAGVSLAACATPRYAAGPGGKAPGGKGSAAKAPSGAGGTYKVGKPYQVGGIWYVPREQPDYDKTGIASWYGEAFHLKSTANGERFDMNLLSAAHTTLPLPSIVEVTNLENGRRLQVRVNDRGPFVGDRIIDLSREAARELGFERQGIARVRVRYVGPAPLLGREAGVRYASARPADPPPRVVETRWDELMEISAGGPAAAAQTPTPPPTEVESQPLPAAAPPPVQASPIAAAPAPPLASAPPPAVLPAGLHVQIGAFSSEANAQRAAAQVAAAGTARVQPIERGGTTLYRVTLPAPADEAGAYALRDQVAAFGFADARVVQAF